MLGNHIPVRTDEERKHYMGLLSFGVYALFGGPQKKQRHLDAWHRRSVDMCDRPHPVA